MVADPASVNTAPETLRALRTHKLLPVLVRELTEPTPYGPDGDEGDGCDADLEEKLIRFVPSLRNAADRSFSFLFLFSPSNKLNFRRLYAVYCARM